ncbi:MAG: imidazole glycerol phosphate synthase subunit HisH [Desulfovibrionaceae bacterium]
MPERVAIVDYRLGNLHSVAQACAHVGLAPEITDDPARIRSADAVILPGVGAYEDAMRNLRAGGLADLLRELAAAGRPLVGICLGMQLLLDYSEEFGHHEGLGLVPGAVVRFDAPHEGDRRLKVPQIGWNRIHPAPGADWDATLLRGTAPGQHFYFVHSYVARPADPAVVLATTTYGHIEFCSSLGYQNIFASQFHPERSGEPGLAIYRNLAARLRPAD